MLTQCLLLPLLLTLSVLSLSEAQGYENAPEPEISQPVTVTTPPLHIDCGPPPTPPSSLPALPSFEGLFTTTSYPTTIAQGYDQTPPLQLPTLPPPPKLPTFQELFPPIALKPDSYAQPKIEYSIPSIPSPLKLPGPQELPPPAPVGSQISSQQYETGPPSSQPQEPYSINDEEGEDMNGDEILLQPAYGDASAKTEQGKTLIPVKAHTKLNKLSNLMRKMRGMKTVHVGSSHHVRMHNRQELHDH